MEKAKFRIELYGNGKYYVEMQTQKKSFFKKEKWICIIFFAGTEEPFGFKTYDSALNDLITEIKHETIQNSSL